MRQACCGPNTSENRDQRGDDSPKATQLPRRHTGTQGQVAPWPVCSPLHLSGAGLEILLKVNACNRGRCISPFYRPGRCVRALQALMRSTRHDSPVRRCYCPHCTDVETEAWGRSDPKITGTWGSLLFRPQQNTSGPVPLIVLSPNLECCITETTTNK